MTISSFSLAWSFIKYGAKRYGVFLLFYHSLVGGKLAPIQLERTLPVRIAKLVLVRLVERAEIRVRVGKILLGVSNAILQLLCLRCRLSLGLVLRGGLLLQYRFVLFGLGNQIVVRNRGCGNEDEEKHSDLKPIGFNEMLQG